MRGQRWAGAARPGRSRTGGRPVQQPGDSIRNVGHGPAGAIFCLGESTRALVGQGIEIESQCQYRSKAKCRSAAPQSAAQGSASSQRSAASRMKTRQVRVKPIVRVCPHITGCVCSLGGWRSRQPAADSRFPIADCRLPIPGSRPLSIHPMRSITRAGRTHQQHSSARRSLLRFRTYSSCSRLPSGRTDQRHHPEDSSSHRP